MESFADPAVLLALSALAAALAKLVWALRRKR